MPLPVRRADESGRRRGGTSASGGCMEPGRRGSTRHSSAYPAHRHLGKKRCDGRCSWRSPAPAGHGRPCRAVPDGKRCLILGGRFGDHDDKSPATPAWEEEPAVTQRLERASFDKPDEVRQGGTGGLSWSTWRGAPRWGGSPCSLVGGGPGTSSRWPARTCARRRTSSTK
jgi:hypothetical protein